ncbi:MAG: M14 family metallopeptidase [Planctomycetota bacterium]
MTTRVLRFLVAAVVVFTGAVAAAQDGDGFVRYDDHALVRVRVASEADLYTMRSIATTLMSDGEGIGFVDYVVSPQGLEALEASGIKHRVLIDNLQPLIDAERQRLAGGGVAGALWFEDFKDYDAVNAKLDELETLWPDLATVFVAGLSLEGRDIRGIRITGPGTDKPAVLLNATQHAREWIVPMVAVYAADRLLAEYDINPVVQALVDEVEFLIIPIVNPDGYIWSWGPDRLWRKNRRDNGDGTIGVDLNRNWAYQWGYDNIGSDPNPGGPTYRGRAPFSEPETQVMRDFYLANPQTVTNIDFHSHGFLILYPWGYDYVIPPDLDLLHGLGDTMAASIFAVHGVPYTNQQGVYLYPTNGGSIDWTYGDQGVFSYTFELRTGGPSGFELPPDEIIPNCEEIFPAVLDIAAFSTQGVQFSFPTGLPEIVEADVETAVHVQITPITAGLEPGTAKLFARVGSSGPFNESSLADLGGNLFQGLLPAAPCEEVVQFYFQVETTDAVVHHSPDDAPASYYEATAFEIAVSFADDFETDQGWTVTSDAIDGAWERGVPVGGGDRGDPPTDADGSGQCYLTDNVDGNSDVDDGTTTLTSPVMDASDPGATIAYYRWYSNSTGADPENDVFVVEVSDNDGVDWVNLETVGPSGPEVNGGWYRKEFLVADIAGIVNTDQFRIRFHASDLGAGSVVEAGVDGVDVRVLSCEPDPCPWDLDGSGDVGVTDFLEMLAVWGQSGVPADFDGGGVSVTDFLILLANWGPCP